MASFREEIFAYERTLWCRIGLSLVENPEFAVLRHSDTGKWFTVIMPGPMSYLGTGTEDYVDVATMKCKI